MTGSPDCAAKEAVDFSVVIPTFNRVDTLREVLGALAMQKGAPPHEIIVVNDGSSDGTEALLSTYRAEVPFRALHQRNQGPGAARNAGVAAAAGRWVAFLGDDTIPDSGWLAAHQDAHRRRADDPLVAVLGYTGWHRTTRLTPFLRYINDQGLQFGYALIKDGEEVPFNFFYTSNISLGRDLLLEEPFDLRFPYAAWEDIEASYRLRSRGLHIVYEAGARTAHLHPTSLRTFMSRQERAGYCAVVFHSLHPELAPFLGLSEAGPPPVPSGARHTILQLLARALEPLPLHVPHLWDTVLRRHYILGLHRGWNARRKE